MHIQHSIDGFIETYFNADSEVVRSAAVTASHAHLWVGVFIRMASSCTRVTLRIPSPGTVKSKVALGTRLVGALEG